MEIIKEKKKRGNPNWIKGKKRDEPTNNSPMDEEKTPDVLISQETVSGNGEQKKIPSNIFSDEIPKQETLPLDDTVQENPYTAIPSDAPPPSPPSDSQQNNNSDSSSDVPQSITGKKELNYEEQQSRASQTVDLLLKGYEKLHGIGRWFGKTDENHLTELHIKEKINLEYKFPIESKEITAGQFFSEYNAKVDEVIVVTDEFKNSIRPPLTRIAIKNKWFVSDELACCLIVAEDLSAKISLLVGLKKSANLVLQSLQEVMKQQKSKNGTSQTNQTSQKEEEEQPVTAAEETKEMWQEPD